MGTLIGLHLWLRKISFWVRYRVAQVTSLKPRLVHLHSGICPREATVVPSLPLRSCRRCRHQDCHKGCARRRWSPAKALPSPRLPAKVWSRSVIARGGTGDDLKHIGKYVSPMSSFARCSSCDPSRTFWIVSQSRSCPSRARRCRYATALLSAFEKYTKYNKHESVRARTTKRTWGRPKMCSCFQ